MMRLFGASPRLPGPVSQGISVDGLSVALGGREVVRGVALEVRPGEILAVVGPNGAGKSTLLGAMAGELEAAAGTVVVDGSLLGSWTAVELAMRRAVLPQSVAISFPFLVGDVVSMGRAPWIGTPMQDRDDAAVAEAMAAAEVTELAGRPHTELSGGERARVTLARVLAQETAILLLDEPTATLDLRHQELVMRVARTRAAGGAAVMVVVHDLGLAAAHADRVAVLESGSLVAVGAPAEVLQSELLSRVYQTHVEVITHPRTGQFLVLPWRE